MLIYHFALPMQIDFILNRIKLISPTVLIAFPIITVFLAEIIKVGDDRINQKSKLVESEEQYRLLTSEMGHGLALHEVILDESDLVCMNNEEFGYRIVTSRSTSHLVTSWFLTTLKS